MSKSRICSSRYLTVGEDPIYGAEILAHNGYIYASSRGVGVIVVYKIGYGNNLTKIQEYLLDNLKILKNVYKN